MNCSLNTVVILITRRLLRRFSGFFAVLVLAISAQVALAQSANCPPKSQIVYIHQGKTVKEQADNVHSIVDAVRTENTMVLLDSDVDITFSMNNVLDPDDRDPDGKERPAKSGDPFIKFSHCVTLASYALVFSPPPASDGLLRVHGVPEPGAGRTPHSLGPALKYTLDARPEDGRLVERGDAAAFIGVDCNSAFNQENQGNGARILGIRIVGPNLDDHQSGERGIFINNKHNPKKPDWDCHDVEIANNEISGWGGAAIRVQDTELNSDIVNQIRDGVTPEISIKIHDNYIHHNQHSTSGTHSEGYGVDVQHYAFADIFHNVFDFNKHSITAAGDSGGYRALGNLILKGGGFRNGTFLGVHLDLLRNIHVVDVHGTKSCPTVWDGAVGGLVTGAGLGAIIGGFLGGPFGAGVGAGVGAVLGSGGGVVAGLAADADYLCGDAGFWFKIAENTFQYSKTTDIKIRGKPTYQAEIGANVFARASQDDAIQDGEAQWYCLWLCTSHNDNVVISSSNKFDDDTFGKYGVCDVDGDGIDDLVLMTGNTWWFSSAGKYPWSFLKTDPAVLKDVQLGDFDGDGRCDVMREAQDGEGANDAPYNWMISSGAREDFKLFVPSVAPLNEVRFGRFNPQSPDFSSGKKRPTDAFWRNAEGLWLVTPLSQPSGWTVVQSSSFPLADLRFGSFRVVGLTDVLANEGPGSHWATSTPAKTPSGAWDWGGWVKLNETLNDPVKNANIFIANMQDNKDDILRFYSKFDDDTYDIKWQWSKDDGTWPWSEWKSYVFTIGSHKEDYVQPLGFVGQFAAPPGASTLTLDESRMGHFYSHPAEDREAGWLSLFAY